VSAARDGIPARRQPIKIGQIGTGNQHAYKMGTLRKLTDLFEVVGIADDDPKFREKAKSNGCYKGLNWMTSDELLAVPGLQAVAVETEEHAPIPTALRCIRAGKHIHLDKPCGESLPQFRQLLDEAKARKLTVQVGYMYRNNPAVQFCIKAVKDGLIGNVFDLDTAMGRYDGARYCSRAWAILSSSAPSRPRLADSKRQMSNVASRRRLCISQCR